MIGRNGPPTPSPRQREAIEAVVGPVLVVAGPGSGKTFCLIERIRYLVERHGAAPERIAAVTFTNKAAEEIARRLRRTLGAAAEDVTRGTLHALCLDLLRRHAEPAGLRPAFGVVDEDYQRRLLARLGVPRKRHGQLLTDFGRHRLQRRPLTSGDERLFERYREHLAARNLVDFDDLIALSEALLHREPAVAAEERGRWDHLLVDECQDLSLAQYGVVRQLAAGHRSVFAVGDEEQSIFSWAGADPRVLERFGQDFGVARPIVLDYNGRCSFQIFEAARRLVEHNPKLFDKRIAAERESEFDVAVHVFADEAAEADWLVGDLESDRTACGLEWGEYALLYRTHRIGYQLEARLLGANIPCRLARGQALVDDEVIGQVVSSLRVIRYPHDPLVVEQLADRVLPDALLQQARAEAPRGELLASLRAFAGTRERGDADARRAWRFVYHAENLRALRAAHDTLGSLVDALLAQPMGRYRNPLEEHAHELTDPAAFPGAAALADRLAAARQAGRRLWLEPDRGVELALERLISAAGVPRVARLGPDDVPAGDDLVLNLPDAGVARWPLLVFKALELLHSREAQDWLRDYVAFDMETSDKDVATCDLVELGAVRVRDGRVVDEFRSLVRPEQPITAGATRIHGWRDEDVREAPTLAELWPAFRGFVATDLLVAHNGQEFDVPVLRRRSAAWGGAADLMFFDTLPLARSVIDGSAKLESLADRFGVNPGRAHHALDDARTLAGVVAGLRELKRAQGRKTALVQLLGYLGLALVLDQPAREGAEERLLRTLAVPHVLGRYGDAIEHYSAVSEGAPGAPSVAEVIERLGGVRAMERLRADRSPAERYPESVARLATLVAASEAAPLEESIDRLLARVALSTSEGIETDPRRVNLLTLHSTKGLEFSRVYVVGVEDNQLPGWSALREDRETEIQEARRLLYVGMTRAKDRLVLTRAERRHGQDAGGDLFLREAGLGVATTPPT